jgi:uncharacterized membrane protein YdbT with pleckstrin-like domain
VGQLIGYLLDLRSDHISRRLLKSDGEYVVDLVTKHWIAYMRAAGILLLAAVFFLASFFVASLAAAGLLFAMAIGTALVSFVFGLEVFLDVFVITNFRVFRTNGVFSTRRATMPIQRILDITVEQPFIGRILGYGHFIFESAAQAQGLRDIRFIRDPLNREMTVQRLIQQAGLRR